MTLEERIKAIMEGKVQDLDEAKVKVSKDGSVDFDSGKDDQEDDQDQSDDDQDDQDGDDDTDFSKETKKNPVAVKEDATNEMLRVGAGKKDAATGKLKEAPSTGDKQDDAGLNAKLKAGFGKKDIPARSVKSFPAAQDTSNSANNVDTQPQTVKPNKITVGESIGILFDGQELSEEFKLKAETIFESAVNAIVEQRVAELEEEFQVQLDAVTEEVSEKIEEAVAQVQSELIENIDGFLDSMVTQWVEDNKCAMESGIKVEMVTNFIDGLKTLFTENYIDVPEDKLDVVEEQARQIAELEEAVVVINTDNNTLIEGIIELKKSSILESNSKGLTLQQKEKFYTLCEGLDYTSDEEYSKKAKTIKESYFKDSKEQNGYHIAAITESVDTDSVMNKYVTTLSGPLKFSK